MLGLPRSTEYGKRIPKQKFYDNLSISPELKRVFAEQIAAIFWSNKLSPDTLNVAAGDTVDEIEVFTIRLNQPSLDTRVLQQIDKQIPYHIIFVLEYKDKEGAAFKKDTKSQERTSVSANESVKYDLVGKIVTETGLTRAAVVRILKGIHPAVFGQFGNNPEEFIIKASALINDQKATVIIQHITYDRLEAVYDTDIFTEPTMKGRLGYNAMEAHKHLYDYILYDSTNERDFATELDTSKDVAVYVKLPSGFFISTPVGKYNPDWAIAFYEGTVKHIYFVAETKGSMSSMQLRLIEESKIHCAREHFKSISTDAVKYDVVDSYESLMAKVMQ